MRDVPRLKDVMTPFPHAVTLEAKLLEARRMMLEHKVHHLPVIDDHELCGIISDRDIKLVLGPEFDYPDPQSLSVSDVYRPEPFKVDINTKLVDVLSALANKRIGAALVTRSERLAGIFTVTDACRVFADYLTEEDIPDSVA